MVTELTMVALILIVLILLCGWMVCTDELDSKFYVDGLY